MKEGQLLSFHALEITSLLFADDVILSSPAYTGVVCKMSISQSDAMRSRVEKKRGRGLQYRVCSSDIPTAHRGISPHQEEPAKVVQASDEDASWVPS